jgi:hypothetical protein
MWLAWTQYGQRMGIKGNDTGLDWHAQLATIRLLPSNSDHLL